MQAQRYTQTHTHMRARMHARTYTSVNMIIKHGYTVTAFLASPSWAPMTEHNEVYTLLALLDLALALAIQGCLIPYPSHSIMLVRSQTVFYRPKWTAHPSVVSLLQHSLTTILRYGLLPIAPACPSSQKCPNLVYKVPEQTRYHASIGGFSIAGSLKCYGLCSASYAIFLGKQILLPLSLDL